MKSYESFTEACVVDRMGRAAFDAGLLPKVESIYGSDAARGKRGWDEVYAATRVGYVAECWMALCGPWVAIPRHPVAGDLPGLWSGTVRVKHGVEVVLYGVRFMGRTVLLNAHELWKANDLAGPDGRLLEVKVLMSWDRDAWPRMIMERLGKSREDPKNLAELASVFWYDGRTGVYALVDGWDARPFEGFFPDPGARFEGYWKLAQQKGWPIL